MNGKFDVLELEDYNDTEFGDFEEFEDFEDYEDFEDLEDPEWDEIDDFEFEASDDWQGEISRRSPEYIRWVQRSLNQILGTRLAVDGIMGPLTRSAVRSFQKRAGITVDGIVGPQTERALIAAGASRPPDSVEKSTSDKPLNGVQACPEPAHLARDRCINPGSRYCPAIPDLLCVRGVSGIPFEYPNWKQIKKDRKTGLKVVMERQQNRLQRFTPSVRKALSEFIKNMRKFALPIEAIITGGSLYCRCVKNKDVLSNHSYGDAIDIVGVRWATVGGPRSRVRETIVHNFRDYEQHALLRRIDACLRLSFATVIDYHNNDHQDHFHCDTNRGKDRLPRYPSTLVFVQEALSVVLKRKFVITGKFDKATREGLKEYGHMEEHNLNNDKQLNSVLNRLFIQIASGRY